MVVTGEKMRCSKGEDSELGREGRISKGRVGKIWDFG